MGPKKAYLVSAATKIILYKKMYISPLPAPYLPPWVCTFHGHSPFLKNRLNPSLGNKQDSRKFPVMPGSVSLAVAPLPSSIPGQ